MKTALGQLVALAASGCALPRPSRADVDSDPNCYAVPDSDPYG